MDKQHEPQPVVIATRAWAPPTGWARKTWRRGRNEFPPVVLVFDCETTGDETQRLTFGAYRVYAHRDVLVRTGEIPRWRAQAVPEWTLIEEGLFHTDDLDEDKLQVLTDYCAITTSDAPTHYRVSRKPLRLRSRRGFVDNVLFPLAVEGQALVVGFNLPFDISRIAVAYSEARGTNAGGFSFTIWQDDHDGELKEHPYKPHITIKTIDSKRAIIQFRGRDRAKRTNFHGHFLDLRTLAFALTNRGHSLASLGEALDIEHPKLAVADDEYGAVTHAHIDYCRRDVLATWECFMGLRDEYLKHPIPLQATRAYSPASVAKGYLDEMHVRVPALSPDPALGLSKGAVFGACMETYYGGRAECHIRTTAVPVVYTDFLSMYPTVNILMRLWRYLTAERVQVVDATDDARDVLAAVTPDDLFRQETWTTLPVLVQLVPDDDILPVRAQYGAQDFQIGINHLTGDAPMWYTLADCVAAKLFGGRAPRILHAMRFVPEGQQPELQPVKLRGVVTIDPRHDDFFKVVIEQRKSLPPDLPVGERRALDQFLKVLTNSGSYGIFIEMNRQEREKVECTVWTGMPESFTCAVENAELPGDFCFPPLATLITGAARLMLTLLERCVMDLGGTYAFCDTDSMAIVATETGGRVPCPNGPEQMDGGRPAVRALSWDEVRGITRRFDALNPYDRTAVPGSVLKVEDVNVTADEGGAVRQRVVWAVAISAKRYALYTVDDHGEPVIVDARAHGLGHLMDPTAHTHIAPDGVDEEAGGSKTRSWQLAVWENVVRATLGLPEKPLPWLDTIAAGRISVSKPAVARSFTTFNTGKPYPDRIKPFNFIITAHLCSFERMRLGAKAARVRLIAPFQKDPTKRERAPWRNMYDAIGKPYRVTTDWEDVGPEVVQVQTYTDVVAEYRSHPEAKSADADGNPCNRGTTGLLSRQHVRAVARRVIGKEANRLDEVEAGLIGDPNDVYTEYRRPGSRLATLRRALAVLPARDIAQAGGLSTRQLTDIMAGRVAPHARTLDHLERAVRTSLWESMKRLDPDAVAANPLDPRPRTHDLRALPLDALLTIFTETLDAVHARCTLRLHALAACLRTRDMATMCYVSPRTIRRWLRGGPPRDPATLATIMESLNHDRAHACSRET